MDTFPQPVGLCRLAVDEGRRHPLRTQSRVGPWDLVWTSLAPESGGGRVPGLVLAGSLHLQTSRQPWALGPRSSSLQVGKLRLWEAEHPAEFTQLLCWAHPKARATSKLWGGFPGNHMSVPWEKAEGQPAVIRGQPCSGHISPQSLASGARPTPCTADSRPSGHSLRPFWRVTRAEPHEPQPLLLPSRDLLLSLYILTPEV